MRHNWTFRREDPRRWANFAGPMRRPPTVYVHEEVFSMSATTWRKHAACRGLDVAAFYPDPEVEADAAEGKSICAECPVRQACLEHALSQREREGYLGRDHRTGTSAHRPSASQIGLSAHRGARGWVPCGRARTRAPPVAVGSG